MIDAPLYPAVAPRTDGYGTNMSILQDPITATGIPTFSGPVVTPLTMIAMRMGWGPYNSNPTRFGMDVQPTPFSFIQAVRPVDSDKAFVFVLTLGNKPVVLEDDSQLFPSDQLITQLRLLEQNGVQP